MAFWDKQYPKDVQFRYQHRRHREERIVSAKRVEDALDAIRTDFDPHASLVHFQVRLEPNDNWQWVI